VTGKGGGLGDHLTGAWISHKKQLIREGKFINPKGNESPPEGGKKNFPREVRRRLPKQEKRGGSKQDEALEKVLIYP